MIKTEENVRPQEQILSVIMHLENMDAVIDNKDIFLLYFIEDIYSNSIAGKIQFADPYGAFELGPITGNERITVVFGVGEDVEKEFIIYKVNKIDQLSTFQTAGVQSFEIFFVEDIFYHLTGKVFSRSWKDTRVSDIVSDICKFHLNDPDFDKFEMSNETLSYFYSPYWTPKDTIKWLIRRASGLVSGQAGYLFYSNFKGMNFITVDNLLNQKPITDELYIIGRTEAYEKNNIISWRHLGIDTTSIRKVQGQTTLGYDSSTKAFVKNEHIYSSSIAKHVLLGKHSIYPDISDSLAWQNLDGNSDINILENINQYDFISRYNRQMLTQIIISGHTKDRSCGDIIEIEWPSTVPAVKINKMMKGYYLIKSITHQFAPNQTPPYIQKIVLVKNAYSDADVYNVVGLVKSSKTNQTGIATLTSL